MTGGHSDPVFLDATVLSNFASTDSVDFLANLLDTPVVATAVRDEIEAGVRGEREYLEPAADALGEMLPVEEIPAGGTFGTLRERLDPGEAESVQGAIQRGGTVATDDLAARTVADRRGVEVTGSVGLLVSGIERGNLDRVTANGWLDTWREQRGYYAPVERVDEVLDDEY